MSDYRRWISYIYAYENGVKKRNAGYAKLELKDGNLTMTLHVTPDNRAGDYRVCLYKSQSGHKEGVLLGRMGKGQGGEGTRFLEDASDLHGSGLLFQEMNGLLLYDDRGKYLISSWEDEPVEISVMQEIAALLEKGQEEKEKSHVGSGVGANVGEAAGNRNVQIPPGQGMDTGTREGNRKTESVPDESINGKSRMADWKTKPAREEGINEGNWTENRKTKSMPEESVNGGNWTEDRKTKSMPEEGTNKGNWTENRKPKPVPEESTNGGNQAGGQETKPAPEEGLRDGNAQQKEKLPPSPEPALKPASALHTESVAESNPSQKTQDVPKEKKISTLESRVFSCLPAMYPFEHQEFERSVRMEPQDLGLLPREMWKYAGNSFLLHSYYAYHHMLFVRKMRGKERNCYLMLPGVYNPKEQHMAQLFGFSKFCPVRKKPLQQGDFGYWYMEVGFPETKNMEISSASKE